MRSRKTVHRQSHVFMKTVFVVTSNSSFHFFNGKKTTYKENGFELVKMLGKPESPYRFESVWLYLMVFVASNQCQLSINDVAMISH